LKDGWLNNDFFIILDELEVKSWSERYAISTMLPGHQIVGLKGWDDFVIRNNDGHLFLVPTVPCVREYVQPFGNLIVDFELKPAPSFSAKIKWYTQPIVFGGDPTSQENMTWVTFDQHSDLVKWWNEKYQEIQGSH
jgi:hypothetical protein